MAITLTADPQVILCTITMVMAVGTLFSTAEWLANRSALMDRGVLSWSVMQRRRGIWSRGWFVRIATPVLGYPGIIGLLSAQGIAAACLTALPTHDVIRPLMLTILVCCTVGQQIRSFPIGFTGADRMRLVVLGALWLRELAPDSNLSTQACLWFIALQCCLSYARPGLTKLTSAAWLSGNVLRETACHHLFGHRGLAAFLDCHPANARYLAWSVMLLQVTFPLALVDQRICLVYLLCMLSFHIGTAILMGFNNFVWSWASTYPAVLYVAICLH